MTMQRRHFEFMADTIRRMEYIGYSTQQAADTRKRTAQEFCGRLSMTNGQFNPSRFLKACGVEG